ncbi:DNA-binding SARP family transcriptional activator [Kribbella sp. VKM Ac-2571]|uniref:AfsR/SARP family transcriptional regulator n=1 Tax=Kribbella sp. VKM Ac-2571 TaxID=2512222 RepID=UPI0010D50C89|nr:BTAD domain-containing putative transcriptional regulator [Kribbella sp. VKM Ac-2571]TDO52908.1 DNA-binding SARP family transcriptional activator [Kribbella sp. VKM Ac-2571]
MHFEVLGPVRVMRNGEVVGPISELRRRLLAVLLVRAGRAVPTDVLCEALWGADVPRRPTNSIQVHVHRLRQVLDTPDRLASVPNGYLLTVGEDELDALIFDRLHTEGRAAAAAGDLEEATDRFRAGLALWRDTPYADVDEAEVVGPEAKRLAEVRLIAHEELFDAELARGRAREIVPELTELVAEYPLRERIVGQHMLALYRSGRRTRAEVAYRAARQRLAKELRTEPGRELRRLGEAIRAEDPTLDHEPAARSRVSVTKPAAAAGAVRPGQLPPVPGTFVGRDPELERLEQLTATDGDGLIVLTGMAGIGKTGLALRYAHQVADRYGDGQLYIDLGGHASGPALDPMVALAQLLRGLGADPARGWESLADATAEYRSVLSGRKLLVLLDNAASAEQVRPLQAATDGCLTLVTSRNNLSGLIAREGAQRIRVGELPPDAAHALLLRLAGPDRFDREPESAAALIEACAGLPLALRIAAAQLADEPQRPLSDYLAELIEHGPVALALDDDEHSAVTAAFDLSYARLAPATRQLCRLLGLVPGLDFTVDAVAALSGTTPSAARKSIRELTSAHLLEQHAPGRYRFHDLLRDDARRRTETEDTAQARAEAAERLFAWYYRGKVAVVNQRTSIRHHPPPPDLPPGTADITFADLSDAMTWARAEFVNLAAAVEAAAGHRQHAHWTWHLAIGLMLPMAEGGYQTSAQAMAATGIAAARAAGDRYALAIMLAESAATRHRVELPLDPNVLTEALQLAEQIGDHPLLGYCLNVAAVVSMASGELEVAERNLVRSLQLHREDGDSAAQTRALLNLGVIAYQRGELDKYAQSSEEVLQLPGANRDRVAALALPELVRARVMLGRLDGVDDLIAQAEDALTRFDSRIKTHLLRLYCAIWYRDAGRHAESFEQARAAERSAGQLDHPQAYSDANYQLGRCHLVRGELDAARTRFESATQWAVARPQARDTATWHTPALRGLAETELAAGDVTKAQSHAVDAVAVARTANRDPVQRAGAVVTLGRVELAIGRSLDAIGHGEEALAIHRRTGHFLGQARAHRLLGEAHHVVEAGSGDERLREALRMFEAYGSPEAREVRRLLGR